MCVVLQHILARETLAALPLHPSGLWCFGGIEPHFAPSKRFAVLSRAGRDFALLLHLHRPRGLRSPVEPSTNPARIGCAPSLPPMDHGQHFNCWTSSRGFAPCTTTKERPWMRIFLGAAQTRHISAIPPFV